MRDDGQVELQTLTRLWLFPTYLYRFLDRPLGSPWNLRLILLAVPAFAVSFLLLAPTPITFTTGQGLGLVGYVLLPGLFVWWALTRLAGGARLWEVVFSQVRGGWQLRHTAPVLRPVRLRSRVSGPWLTGGFRG